MLLKLRRESLKKAVATGNLIGNKIAKKIAKSYEKFRTEYFRNSYK